LDELAGEMSRYEFVLRFTLSHPACQTTIVGTTQPSHLRSNIAAAQAGPLPAEVYEQAKQRLAQIGEEPETSG
jgi:aryl-alcohol dehydrogenase-like predicted oxidoreductase